MLVPDANNLRLAMIGMVEGNGHPYSWSAIINGGFRAEVIRQSPYPAIADYLGAAPREALGIPGVKVTHICCDDPKEAEHVARASLIPNVVRRPEDVIGHVDAVVIATGDEQVRRARPFIEAGLPLFLDKPLVDNQPDLKQFIAWHDAGKKFLSSSCMRYAVEYADCRRRIDEVGQLRLLTVTMAKSLERYAIHALEGAYMFLSPGEWIDVRHSGQGGTHVLCIRHASGVDLVIQIVADLYGGFGCLGAYGTKGSLTVKFTDTFAAFKAQLVAFVDFLRSGRPPFPFSQTVELMKLLIAALRSRDKNGRTVKISEINV